MTGMIYDNSKKAMQPVINELKAVVEAKYKTPIRAIKAEDIKWAFKGTPALGLTWDQYLE